MAERKSGILSVDFWLLRKRLPEGKPVKLFGGRPRGRYFHTQLAEALGQDTATITDEITDGVGNLIGHSSHKVKGPGLGPYGLEAKRGNIYRRRRHKNRIHR